MKSSGLSRETESRIDRICGGIVGFVLGAIAFTTPAKDDWRLIVVCLVGMAFALWRHPEDGARASQGGRS